MKILKRNGIYENLSFDKISRRLRNLANDSSIGTPLNIDTDIIAQKVVSSIYDGISSSELDEEAARIAATLIENYDYQLLASRIIVSNCHKNTKKTFYDAMCEINKGLLTNNFIEYITKNKDLLNNLIDNKLDYNLDYFGFKTLEKSYLLKNYDETIKKTIIIERPQYLYMRVAIGIHIHPTNVLTENDFNKISFEDIAKTYYYLSNQYYTHATPTLFNAGTRLGANSSCYLIGTNDSIEGIFKTISDCGKISKLAGGIGLHVSNIRSKGSIIRGTNGMSEGIVPMLKVYNETAKYINQGGKRKGSFAIYLEPYHADVFDYLDLKKNQGHDDVRARDLFYAMYINDYFMEMVKTNGKWYLMCPDECKGLNDVYGEEFEKLYKSYIEKKMYKKEINAQELWYKILDLQIETGMPYIVYKDNMNKKCNQKNLGTIKSSNLCAEISLYSDDKEYAVCNLCSLCLPKFVKYDENNKPYFDHDGLKELSKFVVRPMNKVIDNNVYPVKETEISNMKHRPIGVGVQGLSDVFIKMKIPFESKEAKQLNKEIFETIYYGCVEGSIEEAKKYGKYLTFDNSPFSQGKLQFHLTSEFDNIELNDMLSGRWNWDTLLKQLKQYGMRNSMLTALMPTASTSQIMGNTECFEQFDSCIFKRRVLSGEFIVCNKYLVKDLTELGLWNSNTKDLIIANNGSIQSLTFIPKEIRDLYKTVWEISMKCVVDMSADRQAFVDQTQSLNLFVKNPNHNLLTKIHFYGWSKKLKTGMYYLRSQPSSLSGKFSVDVEVEKKVREQLVCSIENKDECMACSS
jgi:ribonucleoside-diphosphate reductase alpha chain